MQFEVNFLIILEHYFIFILNCLFNLKIFSFISFAHLIAYLGHSNFITTICCHFAYFNYLISIFLNFLIIFSSPFVIDLFVFAFKLNLFEFNLFSHLKY